MGFDGWAWPPRLRVVLAGMLVLLIAGCGSIGGDDEPAPTATVWPTVNDAADAPSPEASPPWQMAEPTAASTPVAGSPAASAPTSASPAAPEASLPVETRPSPVVSEAVATAPASPTASSGTASTAVAGTPTEATPEPPAATEAATVATTAVAEVPVEQQANPETGDGTSGAPAVSDLPARTPAPATPGANATPAASPEASGLVTSCEPSAVPTFTGTNASFITTSDVNIRVGPGTDCDTAADILPQGTLLTVTSGEVTREGQPDATWVRVEVDGLEGWVSTQFLEPDGD